MRSQGHRRGWLVRVSQGQEVHHSLANGDVIHHFEDGPQRVDTAHSEFKAVLALDVSLSLKLVRRDGLTEHLPQLQFLHGETTDREHLVLHVVASLRVAQHFKEEPSMRTTVRKELS